MPGSTRSMRSGAVAGLALVLAACAASLTEVRKYEGERNIPELVRAVVDVSSSEDVRDAAGYALRRMGEPAVEPLIRQLTGSDFYARGMSANLLGDIGDRRATRPLLMALAKESSGTTALMLAQSIERIGDPSATAGLREMSGFAARGALETIEKSQRCRAEPTCKSEGRCTADADACSPRSDADCRWSEACAKDKRCYSGQGSTGCVADPCAGRGSGRAGCP
jgi:hypothetical protein